jgi:hypothetical protein
VNERGRVCVLYYFSPHKTADTATVSTVARLQARTHRNRGSIRKKRKRFFFSPQHQQHLWVPQSILGTVGSIPWGKLPARLTDYSYFVFCLITLSVAITYSLELMDIR